jgi:hypothetical protein
MGYHAVMLLCRPCHSRYWLLAAGLTLSGCRDHAPVHIHAFLAAGVPLRRLEVAALPFDPDQLLDSLAQNAGTHRPVFSELEGRLQGYRRTETRTSLPSPSIQWFAVRDSVVRMARGLRNEDRRAPGYKEGYARFRQLYTRYTAQEAERERQLRGSFKEDRSLAEEATRASDSLRAWERAAYRDFPLIADQRLASLGRPVAQVQTDSLGSAELALPNGDWWIKARFPQPDNPFEEYDWTLPIHVRGGLPIGLPLVRDNASLRWRY